VKPVEIERWFERQADGDARLALEVLVERGWMVA